MASRDGTDCPGPTSGSARLRRMPGLDGLVIPFDELDHGSEAHDFVGEEHGEVPFSVILVHTRPGGGPAVHRHPYPEVFIVEAGEAVFQLGDERAVVSE